MTGVQTCALPISSRLFLGTFLEFMSCMDESESVNRVIFKGSRCYTESISNGLKFSMDVVDG